MLDQRLRDAAQGVKDALADSLPPDDLAVTPLNRRPRSIKRRPVLAAAGLFVLMLVLVGVVPLLLRSTSSPIDDPPDVNVNGEESVAGLLGEVQGVARSGLGVLWAWDSSGNVARNLFGRWSEIASLPDRVVDVAEHEGTPWAITVNRCDPTVPDWEGVECETTLWQLVDEVWERVPSLDGIAVPDNVQDIEFNATGTLWVVTSDGELFTWDGSEATMLVASGLPNDGISIAGDGSVWASRFNPYFPNDVGFARLNEQLGVFEPVNLIDSGNRHAAMATTADGDLWVWFSNFPATSDFSGKAVFPGQALAFYDGGAGEWTVHESDIPAGPVRAMAGDGEAVWLATFGDDDQLWRFDGNTGTRLTTEPGAEILDVAVASDGTVWYVADNALRQVEP